MKRELPPWSAPPARQPLGKPHKAIVLFLTRHQHDKLVVLKVFVANAWGDNHLLVQLLHGDVPLALLAEAGDPVAH